ncbi:hypothetical protein NECID01_0941 [Nematocida sp. AWRm77]|nr:hypothetical protein NECID01_0941 [Nematocida sp. AWRm77]
MEFSKPVITKQPVSKALIWCNIAVGGVLSVIGNLQQNPSKFLGVDLAIAPSNFWFISNFTLLLCTICLVLRAVNEIRAIKEANTNRNIITFDRKKRAIVVTEEKPVVRREQDALEKLQASLTGVVLCAEIFIVCVFWPLFLTVPHLLLGKAACASMIMFVNLCMHALPAIYMSIDYFTNPIYTPHRVHKRNVGVYVACCTVLMVMFRLLDERQRWRYSGLRYLNPLTAATLICAISVLLCFIYSVLLSLRERYVYQHVSEKTRRFFRRVHFSTLPKRFLESLAAPFGLLVVFTALSIVGILFIARLYSWEVSHVFKLSEGQKQII